MPLFPRHTVPLTAEDSFPRRFAHSLVGTAIITAVLVQSFHAVFVRLGEAESNVLYAGDLLGQLAILLGFTTVHLGNHPVHQWRWRAPLFAVVEGGTAALMKGLLIMMHAEVNGSERAGWSDWFTLAERVFLWNVATILVFALVLGVTVQWVRFAMLRREHRDSTALKIHADHVKQEQEAT
ncbi:MAG TPA: hypothetical protein VMT93_05155 [Gemmatimonadaceae bacterium]|nr:hypothetical protein [Gemmatimonadaceae bacterium]